MTDPNPWAGLFTLGGLWFVYPVRIDCPDGPRKGVLLFTTPGAARLYLNSIGRPDVEPEVEMTLQGMEALFSVMLERGVTRYVLDVGTDRVRRGELRDFLTLLREDLGLGSPAARSHLFPARPSVRRR